MRELPAGVEAALVRVTTGETTEGDAILLRQGLEAAAGVVASAGFEDASQFFRDLARLRAWFLTCENTDEGGEL